jgi:hypothetical protein
MNVCAARSDSFLIVGVKTGFRETALAFLDQVLHNAPTTKEGHHTHPEG